MRATPIGATRASMSTGGVCADAGGGRVTVWPGRHPLHATSTWARRTVICPRCHRPYGEERFGIRLPFLKAQILDRIRSAGDIGITSGELLADLWRDRRPVQATTVKSHVSQINDALVETDWRIHSDGRRWFLTKLECVR